VTDFTLRDYLVSMAHGCDIISTGHLEDCADAYYDTNWGASGQCTFYPYSYPKRMFTALAVLTRVLDAPKFSRRVPTGEPSTYALEFLRQRKTPDFGYAFWTPRYEVTARLEFPAGTTATVYDWQGRSSKFAGTVDFGSTPCYVVASKPVTSVKVLRHYQTDLAGMTFTPLADFTVETTEPSSWNSPVMAGDQAYGAGGYMATFDFRMAKDAAVGSDVLEATLRGAADGKPHTKFEWAAGSAFFKKPVEFTYEPGTALAVRICGNSSFGKVALSIMDAEGKTHHLKGLGYRDYMCFHGWHTLVARLPKAVEPGTKCKILGVWFGSAEWTLDPKEMVPVTDPIKLKDVMTVRLPAEQVAPDKRLEAVAADVMKTVEDKDL
jgi:hypothetical protein